VITGGRTYCKQRLMEGYYINQCKIERTGGLPLYEDSELLRLLVSKDNYDNWELAARSSCIGCLKENTGVQGHLCSKEYWCGNPDCKLYIPYHSFYKHVLEARNPRC
jgi:hypothetical protein